MHTQQEGLVVFRDLFHSRYFDLYYKCFLVTQVKT